MRVELTPEPTPHAAITDAIATPRHSFTMLASPVGAPEVPTEPTSPSDSPLQANAPEEARPEDQAKKKDAEKDKSPPASKKILFLDGLRGLAAMLVIVQHSSWMTDRPVGQPAVDTFFVLSAFLLTMIFEKKARTLIAEHATWRRWTLALADYAVRRILRVYPLFFITTMIVWAIPAEEKHRQFFVAHPDKFNVLRTLIFQFDYRYHVFWTLPLEIMYYVLIPVFVMIILVLRKFWLLPMIPLGYLVAYSGFYWERIDHQPFKPHLPTFLCGSMAAIVYAKADQFITKRKFKFTWWSMLLLRAVEFWCLALLMSTLFNGLMFSWIFTNPIKPGPGGRFVSTNVSVIIVCEMLLPGAISSVLEWSLLRYAGKISFSMYLLHSFVVYSPWVARQNWYDRYWAIWIFTFLLSTVSYYIIEYPCQWLAGKIGTFIKAKDLTEKKRAAAAAVAAAQEPQSPA